LRSARFLDNFDADGEKATDEMDAARRTAQSDGQARAAWLPRFFFGLADGLSIARAVIEFLHNNPRIAAKTLFATHYHELTDAADYLPRVRNFHLAVGEKDGEVRYLHKVEPGRAEKSFGIYVAQLAGLPKPVIRRAT
jgi:hypothetical protein